MSHAIICMQILSGAFGHPGAAAMYSDNGSYAVGVGNASYWNEDRWRFKGGLGYANLELPLLVGELGPVKLEFDWLIGGGACNSGYG